MVTQTISHYEILERLGEGGMGTVYRAVDARLGRPVAVKLLRGELAANAESKRRFMQEAKAASALNHPHIVTVYDIGQDAGVDFIAMEYVAGSSLAQLLQGPRLELADALRLAAQMADALATAHAAGIVHRDLKPANVMVNDKGAVKLLDFGLAKLTGPAAADAIDERATIDTLAEGAPLQTEHGTILGTAAYMSPEQAEGKPADARSDVFSFGAVLYEMVTGRRAFRGDTKMSTLMAVVGHEPESPGRLVPGLPNDLARLVDRCLRKNPDRRWQSMADLKIVLDDLREECARASPMTPGGPIVAARRPLGRAVVAGAGVITAVALLAFGAWWRSSRADPSATVQPLLTKLTSDVGWTDDPALSFDGKLLAYASDRSGERNLDIWVQQISDGVPVRLTRGGGDNVEPSFSADGSKIAFHSNRAAAGIYIVPTLGGAERLLVPAGFSPRFSPDGAWLAYGLTDPRGGGVYIAPSEGGAATRVADGFHAARGHVWSPDGRYLLFWGQRERDAAPEGNVDWYVVAREGGKPLPTGARGALLQQGFDAFQGLPMPEAWVGHPDRLVFHGHVGDSWNMWQVAIAPGTWQVRGAPQRATFGTTDEAAPSISALGRMAFISRTMGADIWSLPIEAERGRVLGPPRRVTEDAADDYDPSISDDGATLVFRSRRAGRFDVFMKNLATNAETVVTQTAADDYPVVSRDGTQIAYAVRQRDKMPVFIVKPGGGPSEQVCGDCGEVEQWTPDGGGLLYVTSGEPSAIGYLSPGSPPNHDWLRHPGYGIFNPRLSSDGRWVAFNARANRLAPARVLVAPADRLRAASEPDWIVVSEDGEAPGWSPQGNLLYFWSNRDGSPCLWAQRLDPATKRPAGEPLAIYHLHSRGLSWRNLYLGAPDIAVARDKIIFNLGEHSGNIWMTNLPTLHD